MIVDVGDGIERRAGARQQRRITAVVTAQPFHETSAHDTHGRTHHQRANRHRGEPLREQRGAHRFINKWCGRQRPPYRVQHRDSAIDFDVGADQSDRAVVAILLLEHARPKAHVQRGAAHG